MSFLSAFIILQAYFLFYFYKQLNICKKQNTSLNNTIRSYNEKISIMLQEYSELSEKHTKLILDTNSNISELKLQLSKKDSNIKQIINAAEKQKQTHEFELKNKIKEAREDTIKRSRSVLRGQASEHLAPFVIKNTNPKDYRFMGNPVDYICFDGLSDVLDKTSNEIKLVRFVDIKTGKSNLNKSQRRIRDAIKDGRVSFEIVNLDEVLNDNSTTEHETESKEKS
jgi:predicted Holliday junction resolvase-like endonuclease